MNNKMTSRTLYFLRDGITGKYFVNASLRLGKFEDAVIHTTPDSIKAGVVKRKRMYLGDAETNLKVWSKKQFPHVHKDKKEALRRQNKPDFAIQIVPIIIEG